MSQAQTRQIGDRTYTVNPLPAMQTWRLQPKLAPAAGELAALYAWFVRESLRITDGGRVDVGNDVLRLLPELADQLPNAAAAIRRICDVLPPGDLELITRTLLRTAKCDGKPLFTDGGGDPFDILMQGRTMDTWKLLVFAVEVSYPDFFASLADARAPSRTPGPSGESTISDPAGPAGG